MLYLSENNSQTAVTIVLAVIQMETGLSDQSIIDAGYCIDAPEWLPAGGCKADDRPREIQKRYAPQSFTERI